MMFEVDAAAIMVGTGALIAVASKKAMEETTTQREDDPGPIAMSTWRETPCVRGRTATEDHARAGRAAFYLALSEGQEMD
jgi:hypothetical protein